jgi:hypothetical protein
MSKVSEDRSTRLALAIRRNRGKALLPDWLERFNSLTGARADSDILLSLEATEQLRVEFVNRMQSGAICYREWPVHRKDNLTGFLRALSRNVGSLEVVLFSDVDEYIGAASVRSDAVLENATDIWEFVGNDLAFATLDLSSGLCVEMNYYTSEGAYRRDGVFSFTGWGVFAVTLAI